jgi:DNA (cytosine-5)-methyltransferase 1
LFSEDELLWVKKLHDAPQASGKPRFKVLRSDMTDKTALELFAGAGGTALGMSNAGFRHVMLNEFDHNACETLRHNRPEWDVVEGDVHGLSFTRYRGLITLLQGGVPCQAFSYAGKSMGFGDTRGTLFFEFARAISECSPEVIMMENVRGLLTHDGGKTIATMLLRLIDFGYRVAVKVLRAQFLDVAQKRERLVILGVRGDLDYPLLFPKQDRPLLTLRDAIGDVPKSDGASYPRRKREIIELVPPGGYWKDLPNDLQREYLGGSYHLSGGKTGMARRLSWNEPSLTLTCAPAQKQTERCHPDETRPLTIREYARIQSFPDDWVFSGSMASQYKQIGNAVPVNMAYHVGKAILAMVGIGEVSNFVTAEPVSKRFACSFELRKKATTFD